MTYGDTARLISSQCANTGPQCLQFWYHMYGSADRMGLNIYLFENNVAKAVWKETNNHGNMWHLAQVDLNTTAVFQVMYQNVEYLADSKLLWTLANLTSPCRLSLRDRGVPMINQMWP